jgi:hypothetical protein
VTQKPFYTPIESANSLSHDMCVRACIVKA